RGRNVYGRVAVARGVGRVVMIGAEAQPVVATEAELAVAAGKILLQGNPVSFLDTPALSRHAAELDHLADVLVAHDLGQTAQRLGIRADVAAADASSLDVQPAAVLRNLRQNELPDLRPSWTNFDSGTHRLSHAYSLNVLGSPCPRPASVPSLRGIIHKPAATQVSLTADTGARIVGCQPSQTGQRRGTETISREERNVTARLLGLQASIILGFALVSCGGSAAP